MGGFHTLCGRTTFALTNIIVAVDGTEYFRSESIQCPDCMEVHVNVKDGMRIDYVHRVVIMYVVGRLHSHQQFRACPRESGGYIGR